jgi:hypothetical protein
MSDLQRDWRRWTEVERVSAWFVGAGLSGLVPVLLLFGHI